MPSLARAPRILSSLLLACALSRPAAAAVLVQESASSATTVLRVAQSEPADVVGNDDVALKAGLDRLRKSGGTLVVGPGRYVIRRSLILPAKIVVRGEPGAVLALPAPVLTAEAAPAGSSELVLAGPHEFDTSGGRILLQILPPSDQSTFADGVTEKLDLQPSTRVEGHRVFLDVPLAADVPAGSRVGLPLKIFQTHPLGLATIEGLTFDGGRVESIPMPGHEKRCAIWASSPLDPDKPERPGPPGRGVVVRHCRFHDWYGRAVALYYQVGGQVEGCLIERVDDEAIDLDHFCEGFRIAGNEIRDARWGIVLNDASRNSVEYNRIDGGEIGIFSWWLPGVVARGINEENVLRCNVVRGTSQAPIRVDRTCVRYLIEHNWVEGEIEVVEDDNVVRANTRLDPPSEPSHAPER